MWLTTVLRASRSAPVAVLALLLMILPGAAPASDASPVGGAGATTPPPPPVIILVHGYVNGADKCPGLNLAKVWRNAEDHLAARLGVTGALVLPISYYKCDIKGVDITGSGPGTDHPLIRTEGSDKPRAGHTQQVSITRVAQDLAWFIHNQFTQRGQQVYVVGHSMGGLIIREALRRVQARDHLFPPSLDVPRVLTMSTPHDGWASSCNKNTQCREMAPGSAFLSELQTNPSPQGMAGTTWWAMGTIGELAANGTTVPCDGIPTDSATAIDGVHLVYTKPCYRHGAYVNDQGRSRNAQGSASLGGRHSLEMLLEIVD